MELCKRIAFLTWVIPPRATAVHTDKAFSLSFNQGVLSSVVSFGDWTSNVVIGSNSALCLFTDHYPTDHFGPGVITTEEILNGTRVIIYRPPVTSDQLLPGFIHFHGGGLSYSTASTF